MCIRNQNAESPTFFCCLLRSSSERRDKRRGEPKLQAEQDIKSVTWLNTGGPVEQGQSDECELACGIVNEMLKIVRILTQVSLLGQKPIR